jgi:uncharacterized protein YqcC (DUF446 family)
VPEPEIIQETQTDDTAVEPAAALSVVSPDPALTDEMSASAWLQTLADAQRAILNSQQANRDLIGVVIQDNFNLKAENHKLRDRMLALERDLTELRRRDEARREAVEARLQAVEAAVNTLLDQLQRVQVRMRPSTTQPGKDPASHKGFWARLLGD